MTCNCEIIVYNSGHIEAAFKALKGLNLHARLITPYAAVASAGVDYYIIGYDDVKKQYPELDIPLLIDCGPYPGYAIASLRAGAKHICVDIEEGSVLKAIQSMATKCSVQVYTPKERQIPQFDMLSLQENRLEDWLFNLNASPDLSSS